MVVRRLLAVAALGAALWLPAPCRAQGCSLCRDTTAGAPAKEREGMRRGILVLGIPAGGVFVGILAVAWKMKPKDEERERD
ncbi:MAG TPA: hypothetical protein VMD58_09815 [Acidobacteriaceae bacterium]|nr:hypothetical protein [Acidobacteriaceae bacterium]